MRTLPHRLCNGSKVLRSRIIFLLLLTPHLFAKNPTHVVVVPVANMYSHPTEQSDVVSQAIYSTNVILLVASGEWSQIQTEDRYKGWTPSRYLRLIQSGPGYAIPGPAAQVNSLFANIYRDPDISRHKPVITIPFGARLEIIPDGKEKEGKGKEEKKKEGKAKAGNEKEDGWLQVRLPDKTSAWILSGDVAIDPKPLTIPESIDLAKRFIGLPYLWGGSSTFGFDCSGFTQMLVRARGITMPRDADKQVAWTGVSSVDRKDLQPGDLLFFGSSKKQITHTGLYIGDGQFINATTNAPPGVQIDRLDDQPWTQLLVACRRLK